MGMEPPQIKTEVNDINLPDAQRSTLKPATKALSDGSHEETPSPSYKHSWTVEQRLTLAMLAQSYSNNWNDLTAVFNRFHKADLRHCGGLRRAVVNTQWNEMRRWFDAAAALTRLQAALPPYDKSKLVTIAALERKASEIGVKLVTKGRMDSSTRRRVTEKHVAPGAKRKRAESMDDGRTDFLPHWPENDSQTVCRPKPVYSLSLHPKTPTKANIQQNEGLLTPPDSGEPKKQRFTADKKLAQIGFRALTAQSQGTYSLSLGIRAGAFLDCPNIPLAGDLDVTTYRREALHHVTKHNHSRPSMFVSATKNPMRALHLLLHAPQGESHLILIDLNVADEKGNVQKAHHLKLRTEFRYTGAGEYLIFGGVEPKAIIASIPLSELLSNTPRAPDNQDPFCFEVLEAHERLSHARRAIKQQILPMTHSLGRAIGEMVGNLCIPPKHFESGVWAFVQDWKFYSAEGARKRGHWSANVAFKDGAIQGYRAVQPVPLASLQIEDKMKSFREIIEIEDESGDESDSSEDGAIPMEIDDWVRKTKASQASLQHFDLETSKWTTREEDLTDRFIAELGYVARNVNSSGPEMDGDTMAEDTMGWPESNFPDVGSNLPADGPELDNTGNTVIEEVPPVPSRSHPEQFENVDELCADVMHMHGDDASGSGSVAKGMEIDYEFSWTGM